MAKVVGSALLVVGVVLLVMGITAADSIGPPFSRWFSRKPTDKSIRRMAGGIVSLVAGAGGWMTSGSRSKS